MQIAPMNTSAAPAVNCCSFWAVYKSMVYIGPLRKCQLHVSVGLREASNKLADDHVERALIHRSTTHYLQWVVRWVGFSTTHCLHSTVCSTEPYLTYSVICRKLALSWFHLTNRKGCISVWTTLCYSQMVNVGAPSINRRFCAVSVLWTSTFGLEIVSASAAVPDILQATADWHCSFCAQSPSALSAFLYNEALCHFALPKVLHTAALLVL